MKNRFLPEIIYPGYGAVRGLANLAPDIVESICSGSEPKGISLARLVKGFPDD